MIFPHASLRFGHSALGRAPSLTGALISTEDFLHELFIFQAPAGTLLTQDEIDQILQIWTSMQRQIVGGRTITMVLEIKGLGELGKYMKFRSQIFFIYQ